jgi:hypothetical protein
MLKPLHLSPSFGFGDRLGLATPAHIQALRACCSHLLPVFAQQSVRENARTGRTPQQVLEDARRAVEAAGWDQPWGADADHLKTLEDLPPFVSAGYTFYTVDSIAHIKPAARQLPLDVLREQVATAEWERLSSLYLGQVDGTSWGRFDPESLLRTQVQYGGLVRHAAAMFHRLSQLLEDFDFEVSVDESDTPVTPLEHFFIASELNHAGVRFTSLALRFPGRFEKGVDYLGDLAALDAEMARHAAVTAHFGSYKISLHSGSDKFSVYPLLVRHWGSRIHVKTAGVSYLEALRTLADAAPTLFERIWRLALERYPEERRTYHVSADANRIANNLPLPSLLDDFHARQILHVTYGSALAVYGEEIKSVLIRHHDQYVENLVRYLCRHLELLEENPGVHAV